MNAWKVILSTLVIFIAGLVTGGLLVTSTFKLIGNPGKSNNGNGMGGAGQPNPWIARNKELLRRMDREFDLTPEQHDRIEKIIDASQERTKFLWKPILPQMNKEMQLARSQIRDALNPDQKKRFDALMRQRNSPDHPERRRFGTNGFSGNATNLTATNSALTNALPANP